MTLPRCPGGGGLVGRGESHGRTLGSGVSIDLFPTLSTRLRENQGVEKDSLRLSLYFSTCLYPVLTLLFVFFF